MITIATILSALGAVLGALNPFDYILIGMIILSDVGAFTAGGADIMTLGAQSAAALVLIAFMKVNVPEIVLMFFFVAFWSLTAPNILSAATTLGVTQYFTVWGIPILTVGFFLPYLAFAVYFIPTVLGYYRVFGLYN